MSNDEILFEVRDRVAILTLNRPQVRNAFGDETRILLQRRLAEAENNPAIGCVVITGAGDAFAAGGDVKGMETLQNANDTKVLRTRMTTATEIVTYIREMSTVVIAAINGAAAGGGMNLALACDIRYASEKAFFSESFVKIGLIPDWGGHYFLTRIVGTSRALELMSLGERIDAETALRLGIVNEIFPQANFMDEILHQARAIADGPAAAITHMKRAIYLAETGSLIDTLTYEHDAQCEVFLSDDAREGINAFNEKRRPKFGGTRGNGD